MEVLSSRHPDEGEIPSVERQRKRAMFQVELGDLTKWMERRKSTPGRGFIPAESSRPRGMFVI